MIHDLSELGIPRDDLNWLIDSLDDVWEVCDNFGWDRENAFLQCDGCGRMLFCDIVGLELGAHDDYIASEVRTPDRWRNLVGYYCAPCESRIEFHEGGGGWTWHPEPDPTPPPPINPNYSYPEPC